MPFSYTTRPGKTYYLHKGPKKGGGIQYFLSTDPEGELADSIPDGFEVYETANGQAYLRRKKPRVIEAAELACVRQELSKRPTGVCRYTVEVSGNMIVVHEAETRFDFMRELNPFLSDRDMETLSAKHAHYMPMMRFVLVDQARRLFRPERYCFRGRVDDWISIGEPGTIEKGAVKYLKHLGRDSFYDLF